MKEIPMLFSTPIVQAILEGRKTQTRRIAAVPVGDHQGTDIMDWGLSEHPRLSEGKWMFTVQTDVDDSITFELKSKYGKSGDLIWERESWLLKGWDFEDGTMLIKYATGETKQCAVYDPSEDSEWLLAQVDKLEKHGYIKPSPEDEERFVFTDKKQPFCPSIHMPKEAARIWLQVVDIRVERLQDITEQDAIAEGIEKRPGSTSSTRFDYRHYGYDHSYDVDAKVSFRTLWESINGPESWKANPLVWVVSFKVLSTTGKPELVTEITYNE